MSATVNPLALSFKILAMCHHR